PCARGGSALRDSAAASCRMRRGALLSRLLPVHGLDFEECQVALPLLGGTHLAHDRVAGAQIEPLDLAGRDVDVVRAVEVVPVGAAEESVAFGKDLEHALAV